MVEGTPSPAQPGDHLERTLRNLIIAGTGQQALFADRPMTADGLARDFEYWAAVVRGDPALTSAQMEALDAITHAFATMSRDEAEFDAELWTPAAMATSTGWKDVRALAEQALHAFGWRGVAGESRADTAAVPAPD